MSIVCVIPARGGSKAIPKKNIMPFCGKPLIAWTIEQALEAKCIDEVYVTSDDNEILYQSMLHGAIPISRPSELATDNATSESAILHALDVIPDIPQYVVFLQATSPLRTAQDIDRAVLICKHGDFDSLFSASTLDDYCIWGEKDEYFTSINFDYKNRVRRQLREPSYLENGSIFVFRPFVLRHYNNRMGGRIGMYEMPFWKSFELDSPEDIEIVEYFFKEKILKGKG